MHELLSRGSNPGTAPPVAVPLGSERSLFKRLGYDLARVYSRLFGVAFCRLRCFGRKYGPKSGAALICANHQSFIDPFLIGLAFDRRMNYLARKTLFRSRMFKWLIMYFDAIPVDQEGSGFIGLKESLKRLKKGEMLLIFPEGARTFDGRISPLMTGACILARRAAAPIIPVGIDGAYDAYPRTASFPKLAPLCVVIGPPIEPHQIEQLSDEQLMGELAKRIHECHERAKRSIHGSISMRED